MPREEIFKKFKAGTLHSRSDTGPKVKSRKQAVAIAMSYPKEGGEKKRRGGEVGRKAQAMPKMNGGGFKVSPAVLG